MFIIECDALMPGCKYCAYSLFNSGASINYYCTYCHAGLFLFSNSTQMYSFNLTYTSCVIDCPTTHHSYVNDPNSQIC